MAELGVERQSAQTVTRAQRSWMRVVSDKRLDGLFERASAASNTGAEAMAELDQLADNGVWTRNLAAMERPAALKQLAERLFGIGADDVACNHLVVLSIETHAKPSGPFAESGFATFQDVTDCLADRRALQPTRKITDWRQTT